MLDGVAGDYRSSSIGMRDGEFFVDLALSRKRIPEP